ncbi:MAG: holo-ACP synthase [Patescibacteria group bacterium]|nr:holo-ACP synthase [Patescibacteria group bacterium]MDE1946231.1 holo-ACP synthase [Patescibacteria group bacterium]
MPRNIGKKRCVAGIDIAEVSRFRALCSKRKRHLLENLFSARELAYCFAFADPAPHLAGTFAAKEAVAKALGTERFPVMALEICRAKNGAPEVWSQGKKLSVSVSITHAASFAAAIAVA